MWFLCIIDMVIWERWGIIKHSSIYKGRLGRSLRVSEWDRHLWKVRYSQVEEWNEKKAPLPQQILPLLGSPQPFGVSFPLKMSPQNTQPWKWLCIQLLDISICWWLFTPDSATWPSWRDARPAKYKHRFTEHVYLLFGRCVLPLPEWDSGAWQE